MNYFTEMCSDSEAGSYLRLIDGGGLRSDLSCISRSSLASWAFSTCLGVQGYFTEMCSGSEAGSYLRLIDFFTSSWSARARAAAAFPSAAASSSRAAADLI